MSALPSAEYVGPGSWTGADVAGYLRTGVPPRVMRQVLARWPHPGDYEDAWRASGAALAAAHLPRPVQPWRDLPAGTWLALAGTPEYPTPLLAAPAAPLLLFGRGNLAAVRPGLAVVGTREMTAYGHAVAETAVASAAVTDVPVHSGAAIGADRAAHEAALTAGVATVAVLATGADVAYPSEHADLLERIVAAGGAVVSEHPFGTTTTTAPGHAPAPMAARLMARNRIIAGLASAVVVAEASGRSGTMGTVWAALGMGRPVVVALPRDHARHLPGAQAPLGLADPRPRTAEELRAMGAPALVANRWAGQAPLASAVARDRDELVTLTRLVLLASPDYQRQPVEQPAAAPA